MNFIEAVLLGIIQGITEFLPISSTAHLTIAGKLLGSSTRRTPNAGRLLSPSSNWVLFWPFSCTFFVMWSKYPFLLSAKI